jgi:hypothetical protein
LLCDDCEALIKEKGIIIVDQSNSKLYPDRNIAIIGSGAPGKTCLIDPMVIANMEAVDSMKRPNEYLIKNAYKDLEYIDRYIGNPMTKAMRNQILEPIRTTPRILPNDPCVCGSGKKYKKCCKNK